MKSGEILSCGIFLAACLGVAAPAAPRPALTGAQTAAVDAFMTQEMVRTHVPGAAVGIYSRGTMLLAKGYGLANVELAVPVKPQTIFQSGSVGKQFVSAAIMMLVEQGRISLGDGIAKYFPGAPASWAAIKIENLLSHTSGLAEYETDARTGPNGPFYLRLDFTENQLLQKIEALPIENAPGARWAYRNTNYVLLGILIHRVTGLFYADYLAKHIFKPLGMTSTRLISEADVIPNRAAGYQWQNETLKNQDWVSPTFNSTADGALYFNVLDLAKWDAALYTTRLLKQSSLDRIWTVYRLNDGRPNPAQYGFAWRIHTQNGHRIVEHGGAWQGFTCQIARYTGDSLTVVVLTNLDAGHARPDYAAHVIAGLVDAALLPQKLTAIAGPDPRVMASLRSALDRRHLTALWPGGDVTLVDRTIDEDDPTLRIYQFRLLKASRSVLLDLVINAKGHIDSLFAEPDKEYRA
ncbi:MAG TPA: serine hydrolase domain-containing protein [Candidatus Baltobacteraceae bacterium]|jgi:CubicO group peptidase (beta-lactamase class C family)